MAVSGCGEGHEAVTAAPASAVRSARRSRLSARAPRIAALAACLLLSLAGLRSALAGPPPMPEPPRPVASRDLAAEGLAERFTRAYLAVDPSRPQIRERVLGGLVSDGDLASDSAGSDQRVSVSWTAAVADRSEGRSRLVTVAADTTAGLVHLAVRVQRDRRGLLAIDGPPALVGGPPQSAAGAPEADHQEVEDGELKAVAERVVRNYLAGERRDLAADLAPEAVVSLPARRLSVLAVEQIVWLEPRRVVAIDVRAGGPRGERHLFRYELDVRRRTGRWQVLAVGDRSAQPNQGGSP